MKTTASDKSDKTPGSTIRRSLGRQKKVAAIFAIVFSAMAAISQAQVIWYLHANIAAGSNYTNPALWFSAPVGGSAAGSINANDIYDANGFLARTPEVATATTFPGGTLRLSAASSLALKGTSANAATINNLHVTGSANITNSASATVTLNAVNLTLDGNVYLNTFATAAKAIVLISNDVDGAGDMNLLGGTLGEIRLNLSGMNDYTGDINLTDGTRITFQNTFVSGGGLNILAGTRVLTFTSSVTFTSLTIAGTPFAEGTYTYAQLNAFAPTIFANPAGSTGTITVIPEPASGLLVALGGVVFVAFRRGRAAR